MAQTIHIGLDLGSDSLKISYAYNISGDNQSYKYGKFAPKSRTARIGIPAIAFYDRSTKTWSFGNEIPSNNEEFTTIVKIKSLISLLSKKSGVKENIHNNNVDAYKNGHNFPLFFFPESRTSMDKFEELVKNKKTFSDSVNTPMSVCAGFFKYAKRFIEQRIVDLSNKSGINFSDYKINICHPSKMGDEYINELERLVTEAFNIKPNKVLTSNKALSMFALERKAVKINEPFLVFDLGSDSIAVCRSEAIQKGSDKSISIDGADSHNPVESIGGIDVDASLVNYINNKVINRETVGSASAGEEDHIVENSVYGKQYLFMKDVRNIKILLSRPLKDNDVFAKGAPLTIHRDLDIETSLTRQELEKSIGIFDKKGICEDIAKYIVSEINRKINFNVSKIVLAGGLIETCGLQDYIETYISKNVKRNIDIVTFDDENNSKDEFDIQSYEDSVYASSVGCAIASLLNMSIKVIFPLSYGTWSGSDDEGVILKLFIERGEELIPGEFKNDQFLLKNSGLKGEEMFSTFLTKDQINTFGMKDKIHYKKGTDGNYYPLIGRISSELREWHQKNIGLTLISGGPNGAIRLKYNGKYINIGNSDEKRVLFAEGVVTDASGKATPRYENVSTDKRYVTYTVLDKNFNLTSMTGTCRLCDIEVIPLGMDVFNAASGE